MRQIVSTMPTEVIGKLLSGIANYSQPGYADLVEALARDFQAACPDKKFFPVSWLRESFRQMIRRTPLSAAQRLIANRAAADAILEVMAGSSAPQTSELGKVLRDFVNTIDARDPVKGLVLRLHYILGLGSDAIVELAANGDARELRKTVEELAAELQQTPAVKNVLDSQNLRPKGNVTLLMEQVRDGQRPLADVIADMDVFKNLQRQAAFSIAREGRISLQASDLLSEFVIRLLPQKPEKAPFNHYEFEALSKRIMHNILVDRSRRRTESRRGPTARNAIRSVGTGRGETHPARGRAHRGRRTAALAAGGSRDRGDGDGGVLEGRRPGRSSAAACGLGLHGEAENQGFQRPGPRTPRYGVRYGGSEETFRVRPRKSRMRSDDCQSASAFARPANGAATMRICSPKCCGYWERRLPAARLGRTATIPTKRSGTTGFAGNWGAAATATCIWPRAPKNRISSWLSNFSG